jgi:predicted Ser/Thr protein kinase
MITGEKIGPFEVEKELGSGAMGTVYRARYSKTGQIVALKLIAPGLGANARVLARFERESGMLKELKHPNIVRLLGTGKHHGSPYFAMEFVDGETLEDVLKRRGRLPWEEVVEIGKCVATALRVAHVHNIVHRDLKPANVMVARDGAIKLTDFGIAKDMDATGLTSANCTVGTAAYMSPEQCRGERDITHKSDLYSLGVMLYELLTGAKPFVAENVMDMFMQHVQGPFVRPAQRQLDVPVWLDTLVCQLMEKKPEQRPLNAEMVVQSLEEVQSKIEALKSAGVDAAEKSVRKGKTSHEREAARALVAGSRRKRLKKKQTRWDVIGLAAALVAGLFGIAFLIYLAVRPAGADKLLQEAERLVKKGDELLETGDDFAAWEKWAPARDKFLHKVLDQDPEGPQGTRARELLKHIEAGNLYGKARIQLRDLVERKEWKAVRANKGLEQFHEILDQYPDDKLVAGKIRAQLGPLEAPVLLKEADELADPWAAELKAESLKFKPPEKWQQATATLERLLRWYPELDAGKQGALVLARLQAHTRGIDRVLTAISSGSRPATLNQAEGIALEAISIDLITPDGEKEPQRDKRFELAVARWTDLVEWGKKNGSDGKPRAEDPEYRPWLLLAEAKIRRVPEMKEK